MWKQTKRLEFVDLEQRTGSFSGNHLVFWDDQQTHKEITTCLLAKWGLLRLLQCRGHLETLLRAPRFTRVLLATSTLNSQNSDRERQRHKYCGHSSKRPDRQSECLVKRHGRQIAKCHTGTNDHNRQTQVHSTWQQAAKRQKYNCRYKTKTKIWRW